MRMDEGRWKLTKMVENFMTYLQAKEIVRKIVRMKEYFYLRDGNVRSDLKFRTKGILLLLTSMLRILYPY